ncbi:hypothetical protein Tco_1478810, partial [Tanacetum coccineum]
MWGMNENEGCTLLFILELNLGGQGALVLKFRTGLKGDACKQLRKEVGASLRIVIADDSAGESPVQKPASENEQALKNVLDKMMDQEKEATKQSDFEAQFNAASTSRTYNNVGSSFVPLGGSFPDDPLMPDLEDTAEVQNTGIFCSAYDD